MEHASYAFWGLELSKCEQSLADLSKEPSKNSILAPTDVFLGQYSENCEMDFLSKLPRPMDRNLVKELRKMLDANGESWRSFTMEVSSFRLYTTVGYHFPRLEFVEWQRLATNGEYDLLNRESLPSIGSEYSFSKLMTAWMRAGTMNPKHNMNGIELTGNFKTSVHKLSHHWQAAMDMKYACTRRPYPFGIVTPYRSLQDKFAQESTIDKFQIVSAHPACRLNKEDATKAEVPELCLKAGVVRDDPYGSQFSSAETRFIARSDQGVQPECNNIHPLTSDCIAASFSHDSRVEHRRAGRESVRNPTSEFTFGFFENKITDEQAHRLNLVAKQNIKNVPACALQFGAIDQVDLDPRRFDAKAFAIQPPRIRKASATSF